MVPKDLIADIYAKIFSGQPHFWQTENYMSSTDIFVTNTFLWVLKSIRIRQRYFVKRIEIN